MALPVSLEEAKRHLRITGDAQDADVTRWIADAAAWVEKHTGHILEARHVVEHFSGLQAAELKAWPVAPGATLVVEYDDASGSPVDVSGARLAASSRPAKAIPSNGHFWPFSTPFQPYRVKLRAGYESADDVPGNLRRAMLVLIGAFDSDREGGEIFQAAEKSARSLCADFRRRRL